MSVLRVRGDELNRLASQLGSSSEKMGRAGGALGGADNRGLGSGELEGACGEFAVSWQHGVGQLGKLSGEASEFLRKAVQIFADADQQLAQALRQGGDR